MSDGGAGQGARVLVVAPYGQDGSSLVALLKRHGVEVEALGDLNAAAGSIDDSAGALLLTEEALAGAGRSMVAALKAQPAWSDLPIVLLAARQTSSSVAARDRLPAEATNVVVLERPLGAASLLSAVESALRARQRQFTLRDRIEELAASERELEAKVAARSEALDREMRTRLQTEEALRQSQKMEAVGQLTGGVAHDFNNLLTIIRSSVDYLARDDLPEARRRRYVQAISETTERAAKLTGQLLAFARRQPLKPEVFDVAERVREVAELVRPLVGSRVEIATELPAAGARQLAVEADVSQFETALVNLAVNARDAMEGEGRLRLAVRCCDGVPAIRGHAGAQGDFVLVEVADTGCGVPPDRLESIFEPFFTTKEVGRGTGLGLSQVFGFVKQSGGEVDVTSPPGEGAIFRIYLPRSTSAPLQPSAPAEGAHLSEPRAFCVLLVEDNESVGQFATEMLRDLGHRSVWVGSADRALRELDGDAHRFDVVFSDVIMPGMNGVELAQRIRSAHPALPVVLTSGYSQVLAEEGAHGFPLLRKPYSVGDLAAVLEETARTG